MSHAASLVKTLANRENWETLTIQVCRNYRYEDETIKLEDVPTEEAIQEAREAWIGHKWSEEIKAKHKTWSALHSKREEWERAHKRKIWKLEQEQKQVASEQQRVMARIEKGRKLRGEV